MLYSFVNEIFEKNALGATLKVICALQGLLVYKVLLTGLLLTVILRKIKKNLWPIYLEISLITAIVQMNRTQPVYTSV